METKSISHGQRCKERIRKTKIVKRDIETKGELIDSPRIPYKSKKSWDSRGRRVSNSRCETCGHYYPKEKRKFSKEEYESHSNVSSKVRNHYEESFITCKHNTHGDNGETIVETRLMYTERGLK